VRRVKLVAALWDPDIDLLLCEDLRRSLAEAGATRLQVNIDDDPIPDSVLRLRAFDEPLTCVVSVWTDGSAADTVALLPGDRAAAWEVEQRTPLTPPETPDGERLDGLAQVAFLRRPAELPYDDWLAHWHGPHTEIAIETQATFGYIQNRVVRALTDDTPHVDAIVEELFPTAAMSDIHAFYGSDGSQDELDRRITRLMESVSTMGADRNLDVVPTSRYLFGLHASPPA
jgi:hypothetical protein